MSSSISSPSQPGTRRRDECAEGASGAAPERLVGVTPVVTQAGQAAGMTRSDAAQELRAHQDDSAATPAGSPKVLAESASCSESDIRGSHDCNSPD
jgi:hypothetical protein